jgi:putative ABC transport system permease protein
MSHNHFMTRQRIAIAVACAATALSSFAPHAAPLELPSVLVSRQLLESERLTIGDVVSLSSDPTGAHPRRFRIAGAYEPVPDPLRLGATRHEARLHLPDLLDIATDGAAATDPQAREAVDAINVSIGDAMGTESVTRDLSTLPGIVVRSSAGDDQRAAPFIVLERFHLAIAIVTVVASSIFLLALMLMLVDERRETVGILRLVGVRRRRIVLYVFAEGLVLAAAGAVVGILLSAAFQGSINRFFQWRYDTALVFVRITPRIALRSVAMAVPLGVLAAMASSWTLLRQDVLPLARR